jgi:hypothetical protein
MADLRPPLAVLLGGSLLTMALVGLGVSHDRGLPSAPSPIPSSPPSHFIAFARDFRAFRTWERHSVAGAMMPVGAAEGPTYVYLNRRAPAGSLRWPVGTMIVKAIESGAPHQWTVHAMVKRGLPFNSDGALGWEYFELRFSEGSDEPVVVWRGNPPSGHGYAAAGRDPSTVPLVCNDCHTAAWQNDSVLTPALSLRR